MGPNHPLVLMKKSFLDELNNIIWYNTQPAFYETETLHYRIYFPCEPTIMAARSESSEDSNDGANDDSDDEIILLD